MSTFCSRKGGAEVNGEFFPVRVTTYLEHKIKAGEKRLARKQRSRKSLHLHLHHMSSKHAGGRSPNRKGRSKVNSVERFQSILRGRERIAWLLNRAGIKSNV